VTCVGVVARKSVKMSSVQFDTGGEEEVPPGRILKERDGVSAARRTIVPVREGGDQFWASIGCWR
jgi:hypothetical protein